MRADRIYEHRIVWDTKLMDKHSEPFGQLSYESIRAVSHSLFNNCHILIYKVKVLLCNRLFVSLGQSQ